MYDMTLDEAKSTADEIYRAIAAVTASQTNRKKVVIKDNMVDRRVIEEVLAHKYPYYSKIWSNNVTRLWDTVTLIDDIVYCNECKRQHRNCPHACMKGHYMIPLDMFIETELPEERYFQTPGFKQNFEYVQKYLKRRQVATQT
jgi:hypothetical protein